jgi:hypothetical protein
MISFSYRHSGITALKSIAELSSFQFKINFHSAFPVYHLIIGRYFSRFSIITQMLIASKTSANGSPDGRRMM